MQCIHLLRLFHVVLLFKYVLGVGYPRGAWHLQASDIDQFQGISYVGREQSAAGNGAGNMFLHGAGAGHTVYLIFFTDVKAANINARPNGHGTHGVLLRFFPWATNMPPAWFLWSILS